MFVKDFITKEYPVLKIDDTGEYALALMDDFKTRNLPLLDSNGLYKALIFEKDLLNFRDAQLPVINAAKVSYFIRPDTDWLEALGFISQYNLSILPVASNEKDYYGIISTDTLIEQVSKLTNAEEPGAMIILEIYPQDYSATDIARIIESNNAHLLSLLTQIDPTSGNWLVSLKIDIEDASTVLRSFERFNYQIKYAFMKDSVIDDILAQRISELNRFMNI